MYAFVWEYRLGRGCARTAQLDDSLAAWRGCASSLRARQSSQSWPATAETIAAVRTIRARRISDRASHA
jgi:uncharacterized alpha-E superfamily protein